MKLFRPARLSRTAKVSKVKTTFKSFKGPSMRSTHLTTIKAPRMSKGKVKI